VPVPALVTVVAVPEIIPEYVPAVACVTDKAPPLRVKFPVPLNAPVVAVAVRPRAPDVEPIAALIVTFLYAVNVRVAAVPEDLEIAELTVISPL